jgi:hypothetical protein
MVWRSLKDEALNALDEGMSYEHHSMPDLMD